MSYPVTQRLMGALMLPALLLAPLAAAMQPAVALAQDEAPALTLTPLGTYATGVFDGAAAEIVAYDPETQQAYVVNVESAAVDILDISDPAAPTLVSQIDITPYGAAANSVDVSNGVLAAAVEANEKTDPGAIVFFDTAGAFLGQVEAGSLPDMVTFTPDGSMVISANEGEPNDDYSVDPEGSVTIVDISDGVEGIAQDAVTQVTFEAFNESGVDPLVRIFGPNATVAQDLEPEYVAVSADSATAWVTLQENNAVAAIDLAAGEVVAIVPLGFKDHSRPFVLGIDDFEVQGMEVLGQTPASQDVLMGGLSGLWFEGLSEDGASLIFVTHTDRGPNADPTDVDGDGSDERPFVLADFQPRILRLAQSLEDGSVTILETIGLSDADGVALTGLPNLADVDERPVDLLGAELEYDALGGDFEAIVVADDGSFWMADEYRPSIYHFAPDGLLIDRFVPEGANDNEAEVEVGTDVLPETLATRRANRGFEALALDGSILYAFVQSPLDNPASEGDANSKAGRFIRIVAFDTASGETVGQYLYELVGDAVDKIGDAVALGNGEFLVLERDDATGPEAGKYVFRISLDGATNLQEAGEPTGLELQSAEALGAAGIRPVLKQLYVDLTASGYQDYSKPEGLALIDSGTLAIVNDNDFGLAGGFDPATGALEENPDAAPSVLSLVSLKSTALDASDRDDGIFFHNPPVLGMFMPDSIVAYEVGGETFLVTANEGDARDYDGFSEETRVGDLVLNLELFPNAGALQQSDNIGRLRTTSAPGGAGTDVDGDGFADVILAYGARSFSIWDTAGNLVWDSGDEIERLTAELLPEAFNSNGQADSFDGRSDDKGPEPEALDLGVVGDRTYAFVGLERTGGVMVYDITDPRAPFFVSYGSNSDVLGNAEEGTAGDVAPEGIRFVTAEESPTGAPLLLVANEVSGSTTVYAIEAAGE